MKVRNAQVIVLFVMVSTVFAEPSVNTAVKAPERLPSEICVVVNSVAPPDGSGTASVLIACRALVGGDSRRILDAGKAYESLFGTSVANSEPSSAEATTKARWLRDWLAQKVRLGGTVVLVGDPRSLPTWHVRLGSMTCTTDSFYTDLDGNGIPETAVCRILGSPEVMVQQIMGKKDYGERAIILCSEDTRIHMETRAFAKHLSPLGYSAGIWGARTDQALAVSDLIIHFGHGSPVGIANRFGETFVSADTVPGLARSPIVFVDGCGTLPIDSPLLKAFLEQGAIAYVGSTETVQGMIPARFTNELVEHFLHIGSRQPDATVAQLLVAARAEYVRGHPGLAENLRDLALAGEIDVHGDQATHMVTVAEWVYYGDPRATLPRVGKPKELPREVYSLPEPVKLNEGNSSWQCSFTAKSDDGLAVLAIYAEVPITDRNKFRLSVRHNQKHITDLDGGNDTIYQNLGQDCRGGYTSGEVYRARFLAPLDCSAGEQSVQVHLESGSSVCLMPGTSIDVWPVYFEKLIGLRHASDAPVLRQASRPVARRPAEVVGVAKLYPMEESGFVSADLSALFNRRHDSVRVGGGDNASFRTWFTEDGVSADGVPFNVKSKGNDVLVSATNMQNVFEIKGLEMRAKRVHLLLWGYNRPRQPARLEIRFKDDSIQACYLPLREWTEGEPPVAFDFANTIPVFRHAAITHGVIDVSSPAKEIASIRSLSGTYGLIAITLEE